MEFLISFGIVLLQTINSIQQRKCIIGMMFPYETLSLGQQKNPMGWFRRSNLLRLDSLVSGGPVGEKISGEQFLSATLITRSALRSN